MRKIVIISVFLMFSSCLNKTIKDPSGVYVFDNRYIIDSLVLYKDFSYQRKIFNKETMELLYSSKEKWHYAEERLELKKFLNKVDSGVNMVNSKDSTFRAPIINTRLDITTDIFGNLIFDIDRFNNFKKIGDVSR